MFATSEHVRKERTYLGSANRGRNQFLEESPPYFGHFFQLGFPQETTNTLIRGVEGIRTLDIEGSRRNFSPSTDQVPRSQDPPMPGTTRCGGAGETIEILGGATSESPHSEPFLLSMLSQDRMQSWRQ